MAGKPKRGDFVVSRLSASGSIRVLWAIFRGTKHVKGHAYVTKHEAATAARRLARKAKLGYWVQRGDSGIFDEGKRTPEKSIPNAKLPRRRNQS